MENKIFNFMWQATPAMQAVICDHEAPPKKEITLQAEVFLEQVRDHQEIKKPQTAIWGKENSIDMSHSTISRFYCNGIFFVHSCLGLPTMKKETYNGNSIIPTSQL